MPVKVELADVTTLVRRLALASSNAPKAFRDTVVSVGKATKTEGTRAASAKYNVSTRRVGQDLWVDTTRDAVKMTAKKKPITLKSYGAKPIEKIGRRNVGVVVSVMRDKGPKQIRKNVFWIKKAKGVPFKRIKGAKRYPIGPVPGPSAADMMQNKSVYEPFQKAQTERATKELNRQIRRALTSG